MSMRVRKNRGHTVVWGLLALVMVGFGGYGVSNFSQGVNSIGKVGDREISVQDYTNMLRQEIQAFSTQVGQPVSFAQAEQMGLVGQVQATLVAATALESEAASLGVSVGDAQIRNRITSAPAFRGADGAFNRDAYTQFLRQQNTTEQDFEQKLRDEGARTILQGAVVSGVHAPPSAAERLAAWRSERRSFTYGELVPADLAEPVPAPTDDEVKAWYDGHNDRYMRPETRKISYILLSPDDVKDEVKIDEATLQDAYAARKDEFIVPERRDVSRLVYPSAEEAAAAKARYDAGTASFEQLVRERGLEPADVSLGDLGRDQLGVAADPLFALTEPAVIGPIETDLGPALFAMNAILPAQETTFDEARTELNDALALDRARRIVSERSSKVEDALASGASLEDVARENGMKSAQIDYNSESDDPITGYEAFRKAAEAATTDSFPSLVGLDDGGVFALQLDSIAPPALKPLDEVRDQVAADWTADETHKALVALAGAKLAELDNGVAFDATGIAATSLDDFQRDGFVQDADPALGKAVFEMTAGTHRIVEGAGKVYLLTLDAITPADKGSDAFRQMTATIGDSLSATMSRDLFELYDRAIEANMAINLNSAAIEAVNAQLR